MVSMCHLFLAHTGAAAPYTSNCRIQMLPTSALSGIVLQLEKKKHFRGRNGPGKPAHERKPELLK